MNKNTSLKKKTDVVLTLEKIDAKLKTLNLISDSSYKTHCKFRWNPAYTGNDPIDISKCLDISLLLQIYASIKEKTNGYIEAAKENGIDTFPVFQWQNHSWEDWKADLKLRINMIFHKDKYDKLIEAKNRLQKFLTAEDQLALIVSNLDLD